MSEGLKALENIKIDMEYVTRLDFVEPIVRGEVQQNLYKIYHRETPELDIIEKELKDYQEIKEIAKHFNWDDFTSEVFSVETDKKYRDLFNSAIVDIQKDYRKARAFEIIKEKKVNVSALLELDNLQQYNDYCDMVGGCKRLAQEEYDLLKEILL